MRPGSANKQRIQPVGREHWPDLVRLFGERGACGGCWCMFPRLTRAAFDRNKGAGNRRALRRLVHGGRPPGLLAYEGELPVGWCAVEPREAFSALARSRLFQPLDDLPVWSIVCLFVTPAYRRQGVSERLIRGALVHARQHGARCVEAYAVEPARGEIAPAFAYHGLASAYRRAGFKVVASPSPTRRVMRRRLRPVRASGE